jgi:hypothetical protein
VAALGGDLAGAKPNRARVHGSSSTIEDFFKQYSRTLKNYSKRIQDYSNYYSRLQRARGLVGHTPRVLMQGRKKTDSY